MMRCMADGVWLARMLEICDELQPRRGLFGRLVTSLENPQPESEYHFVVKGAAAALAY